LSIDALRGRVALVTGGSGGIGAAICRELAAAGADVAVGYGRGGDAARAVVDEISSSSGGRAMALGADLFDAGAPAQLVTAVEAALGPIDILVANHGHARVASYAEVDAAAFDRTLAINVRAPFLLAQAVLPGMCERQFGRILFMSSTAAFRGGIVGPDYAASKAALHGLTFYLSSRVAADGVTVNAIAPGLIDTAMLPGDPSELGSRIPVGRVGRTEEVADLTLAVLRNGYITNHVFSADGGMHPG
jgi:3-oxoacyl-[acyl-carrier protein] reductase